MWTLTHFFFLYFLFDATVSFLLKVLDIYFVFLKKISLIHCLKYAPI